MWHFCTGWQTGVSTRHFGDIAKWISHFFENDVKVKVRWAPNKLCPFEEKQEK